MESRGAAADRHREAEPAPGNAPRQRHLKRSQAHRAHPVQSVGIVRKAQRSPAGAPQMTYGGGLAPRRHLNALAAAPPPAQRIYHLPTPKLWGSGLDGQR